MGPRKFVATGLTDFLLEHGHLDARVRRLQLERCLELTGGGPASLPWWKAWTLDVHQEAQPIAGHHSALLLAAALAVTYHIGMQMASRRRGRVYTSHEPSRLSRRAEELSMFLASLSLCLVALRVVLTTHSSLSSSVIGERIAMALRSRVYSVDRIIGVLEELPLRSEYLYTSSLWSVLVAAFLTLASAAWSALDPRSDADVLKTWRSLAVHSPAGNAAVAASVGVVLWLAYADLPLFNKVISGEIRIDLGLPLALIKALEQTLFSFFGFCIFHKLFPRETESTGANEGTKKPKKYVMDPVIVKRMSDLASEARERVQARKNGKQLRRTYSMGDFMTVTPPPSRRRELRSSFTRQQQPPPSPLLDIRLAGPTLSSKDLLAKLNDNASTIRRSASSSCLVRVPESLLMPTVLKLPNLAEEEKVYEDDMSASTPTHVKEDITWSNRKSNPQSSHTPVLFEAL